MRKELMFFALAAMGLASCNNGYKQGDNGMLYKIYVDKPGTKIKDGDFANANIIVTNDADSLIQSTYDDGTAQPLLVQSKVKGDIFSAMHLLTEGDSASFKLPVDSIYKGRPAPPMFKGKFVVYTVKIEKVIPKGNLSEAEFESKFKTFLMLEQLAIKNGELARIKRYIADNNLNAVKTDSGLYYVITKQGVGPLAAKGDTVVVNYTGSLLTGKVFDTSIKEEAIKAKLPYSADPYVPVHVLVGQHMVMPGWDQGLLLLNKGAEATFIIPSKLAYGEQGKKQIGPFTPLAFNIEVVNIIHPKLIAVDPAMQTPALPPVKVVKPVKK